MRNSTDVELAGIDSDCAVAVGFKIDGKLDEKFESYFQCAMLYTNTSGIRLIRVINLSLSNTASLNVFFRYADIDTTLAFLSKQGKSKRILVSFKVVFQTLTENLKTIRDQITFRCVKTLAAYKKFVANSGSVVGQLILPESFKLYPLFALSLIKSKAFGIGPNLPTDERNFHFKLLLQMNASACMAYFYPRMISLHALTESCGYKNSTGRINIPPKVRLTCEYLEDHGMYIIGISFN